MMAKAKSKPSAVSENQEVEETNEVSKIVWLKADGREIELFDTPELAEKAEELGWKKAK